MAAQIMIHKPLNKASAIQHTPHSKGVDVWTENTQIRLYRSLQRIPQHIEALPNIEADRIISNFSVVHPSSSNPFY